MSKTILRAFTFLGIFSFLCQSCSARAQDPALERACRLLSRHPVIDGHNDLPGKIREKTGAPGDLVAYDLRRPTSGDTDLERLRAGGVGGQFWSVYIPASFEGPGAARAVFEQIDVVHRLIAKHSDTLELALTADDITRIHGDGKIASLIGMEGGHSIENSLAVLRRLYAAGARSSITSLWRVDDALTRELMTAFYENLWTKKMGKADALRAAKTSLREQGYPVSAWAGWVLTGDPD